MCGAGPFPDRRDLTFLVQADEQKNLEQDPVLQVTRVRDGAKTRKAAASTLRRNSKAPFALMPPIEFVERAEPASSASSEIQLLLLATFQVSVSWVEIPFTGDGISFTNASNVPKGRFTREEKLWSAIFGRRKPGKKSRILREFTKM
jgi:hypothetical protein